MTGEDLLAALQKLGGVAEDLYDAGAAGFANLDADLTAAEDVAALLAPFFPAVGMAAELLPALGLLVSALPLLNIQGGVGANIGPGNGDPLGIETGR